MKKLLIILLFFSLKGYSQNIIWNHTIFTGNLHGTKTIFDVSPTQTRAVWYDSIPSQMIKDSIWTSRNAINKLRDSMFAVLNASVALKLNITDTANIRFRAHAGTYIILTGAYPDLTFKVDSFSVTSKFSRDKLKDSLQANITANTTAISGKQPQLSGTGFVKATGTTISYDNSTYITGNQTITLSGNVTGSGTTAITTTISNNVVTNAMLAQMAAHTYKGNNTGSTANAADITSTQLTADLNTFTTTLNGLVPNPGSVAGKVLSDNGTWITAGGLSGMTTGQAQFAATSTTLGGNNRFYWDDANTRLILGRNFGTAPAYKTPLTVYQDSTNVTYNDPAIWIVAHNRTNGLVFGTLDHSSYIGFDALFNGGSTTWKTIAGSNAQSIIYKDQAGNLLFYLDNNGAANTNYTPTERYRITINGNMLINSTSDDGLNKLQVNGGVNFKAGQTVNRTVVADAAYTLLASDYLVSYTSLTATRAVSPPGSPATNQTWVIKNETANTSAITFVGTLDGAVNPTLINTAYGTKKIFYNGSAWFSIQ